MSHTLCLISLPEAGIIVGIAVILFGCKAVTQKSFYLQRTEDCMDTDHYCSQLDWSVMVLLHLLYEE